MKKSSQSPILKRLARSLRQRWREARAEIEWRRCGCPPPPPHRVKTRLLRRVAKQRDIRILVETGTFQGDTLAELRNDFARLHSIELSDELFNRAMERFKNDGKVSIWHGDSGEVLSDVVETLREPALFWLDGHYSGGETALRSYADAYSRRAKAHCRACVWFFACRGRG